MTNTPTDMPSNPTTVDLMDELCELGFFPIDDDFDATLPGWVSTWRAEHRMAVAYTRNQPWLVLLYEYPGDERFGVEVTTRSGVEIAEHSFPQTRTGATLMLALLAAAVEL